MHIGGMRTALFNWLWARHNNGQFILRIDDTDQQRNMDEALGPILDAFRWLGLDWDEGPEVGGPVRSVFPVAASTASYDAALKKLLDPASAYRDFETPEDTQAQREAAEKEKQSLHQQSRVADPVNEEVANKVAEGRIVCRASPGSSPGQNRDQRSYSWHSRI
jgi:glutamyl-tRNA synthetase